LPEMFEAREKEKLGQISVLGWDEEKKCWGF
jgi:hypothetical protein